jgi:HSP20 family protein
MAEKATPLAKSEQRPLRRLDPLDMLEEIRDEMAQFWGHGFPLAAWPSLRALRRPGQVTTAWAPTTDVYEQNGAIVVKAELPGIKKEDIEVTLDGGDLVIRGERKTEQEVKEEDFYRMERTYGTFYRRLPLPAGTKADQIKTTFTDGVLEVRIPKPAETTPQPQKIAVG